MNWPFRFSKLRKTPLLIWLFVVTVLLSLFFFHREWFDLAQLEFLLAEHKLWVVLIYLFILSILGLFFIPSTPFAVAGVLLFPAAEVYVYNLIGILTSSFIVYYFAQFLRLDEAFHAKHPLKIRKLKSALKNKELPIIIGWSAFPLVPTDLIIYVSSTLKIKVWKALLGVLIGEGILNAFYILSTDLLV